MLPARGPQRLFQHVTQTLIGTNPRQILITNKHKSATTNYYLSNTPLHEEWARTPKWKSVLVILRASECLCSTQAARRRVQRVCHPLRG